MERPKSEAPLVVACLGLVNAVVAHAFGWGFLLAALPTGTSHGESGLWMLGGSGLSLVFNGFALVLGIVALALRNGKEAPYALPIAVLGLVLGAVGLIGVLVLGLFGLIAVTPGVQ